jgi:RNA polymerase sigma-70 factor (ECF subfamily)
VIAFRHCVRFYEVVVCPGRKMIGLAERAVTGGDALPEIPDPVDAQYRTAGDEDAVFVARCRRGDPDAFAVLVRRHQKRMLNIAYRMIGDYSEACDVVQEAFLSAWRGVGNFRGEARFSTWLCGIVLNHGRNHLRLKSVRSGRWGVSFDDPATAEEGGQIPSSLEESAIERLERRELEARVQEGIDSLDGEQREVLVLRDIQGYSYEEIGAMLKLPQGTVRSRLFRARSALKENLLRVWGDLR